MASKPLADVQPAEKRTSRRHRGMIKRWRGAALLATVRLARRMVGWLTLDQLQRAGRVLGRIAAAVPTKRRRRVEKHLSRAMPELDEPTRRRLVVESFQSSVCMGLETGWLGHWDHARDGGRMVVETPEAWQQTLELARERGRGLIFFVAHHGCTELMLPWFRGSTGMELLAVAGRAKIEGLTEEMTAAREGGGARVVLRGEAALAGMRHLRNGGAMAMLVDHNLAGPGVELPFFGQPAHTLLVPARLALQAGAVCNTCFAVRGEPGTLHFRCGEPMVPPAIPRDANERFRAEVALARWYTGRIEEEIRRNPGQYLWMHKRWAKRSDSLPLP